MKNSKKWTEQFRGLFKSPLKPNKTLVETAKEESVENPDELEAEKLSANVAVTVTSPQGTE